MERHARGAWALRRRWRGRGRVSVYITLHNSWSCHRRERRIMVPYWSWPPLSMVRRRQPTWIRRMTITTRTTPWPGLVVVQCSGFTHRAPGTVAPRCLFTQCGYIPAYCRRQIHGCPRCCPLYPTRPTTALEIVVRFLSAIGSDCAVYISAEL